VAHALYRQHGYVDILASFSAFMPRNAAPGNSSVRAEPAGVADLSMADALFRQVASHWLGFAVRYEPFFPAMVEMGELHPDEVWLLWKGAELIGYAVAKTSDGVMTVRDLLLVAGTDATAAIASLRRASDASYFRFIANRTSDLDSLQRAGYQLAKPGWGTFMVKPLHDGVSAADACCQFGIGTDRFLFSWLDVT
jgi:hypothetical protein